MDTLFSIIIPCHNSIKYLYHCYNSLINQSIDLNKLQIIFVDDASTDLTYQLLCEMEQMYPENILVIHLDENVRQGGARNVAITYATGTYISFIDSDDYVDLSAYEELEHIINTYNPDIIKFAHTLVTTNQVPIKTITLDASGFYSINNEAARKNLLISEVLGYGCWNKIYRRDIINEIHAQFAERLVYEEPKFTYPLLFNIKSYYLLDKSLYNYTYNPEGTMQSDMRTPDTLLQHPEVQLQTLNAVMNLPDNLTYSYQQEIEAYFVKSFFCETILFSIWGNLKLDIASIQFLKDTLLSIYPNYDCNPYITNIFSQDHQIVLSLLTQTISDESVNNVIKLISRKEN